MSHALGYWSWGPLGGGLWLLVIAGGAWALARARQAAASRAAARAPAGGAPAILVAFASQTGRAEDLARMTALSLSEAGTPARVALLGDLEPDDLRAAGRVLIVASTTGRGDAPDAAAWFVRQSMKAPADLAGLCYGLLALGDRTHADFCGFGRALDDWLQRSGATALFDRIEVDDGDAAAIGRWRRQLSLLNASAVPPDRTLPARDRRRTIAPKSSAV